jgi:hypothetical protein
MASESRLFAAVNPPRLRFPVVVSLGGVHLLGDRLVSALVSHSLEALTVELVEPDAVGLVGDEEIEDGPDEREAAFLAGEAAHHRAFLTILREGGLYGTQLAASIIAYGHGELAAEALSERFARSRVVDHTPSFSWEKADWRRVLDLVVRASLDPAFEPSDPEHVAATLAEALAAESAKMRETLDKLASPVRALEQFNRIIGRTRLPLGQTTELAGLKPLQGFAESLSPLRSQRHVDALCKPGIAGQVRKLGDLEIGKVAGLEVAWLAKRDALNRGAKAFNPKVLQLPHWFGRLPDPAPWLRQMGEMATTAAEAFKRVLPANWRGLETAQLEDVLELMKADGYGLAWVPRDEILRKCSRRPTRQLALRFCSNAAATSSRTSRARSTLSSANICS